MNDLRIGCDHLSNEKVQNLTPIDKRRCKNKMLLFYVEHMYFKKKKRMRKELIGRSLKGANHKLR